MARSPLLRNRALSWLLAATVACYAIGYPLALGGGYSIGWVFVTLGGVLLAVLGVRTVREVHRSNEAQHDEQLPPV